MPYQRFRSSAKRFQFHPIGIISGMILIISILFHSGPEAQITPLKIGDLRPQANKAYRNGNYNDALLLFKKILTRQDNPPDRIGNDLHMAVNCLVNLNRQSETDALRETVIEHHGDNWRLLWTAAQSYLNTDHSGYIIAGKFERGRHRGGGKYVSASERDRVRALQLMVQAMPFAQKDTHPTAAASFFQSFAEMWLQNRYHHQASWELQTLTRLDALPDYTDGYYYRGSATKGAPVTEDGRPVFYDVPTSFAAAQNDGERRRWCLRMAVVLNPKLTAAVNWTRANFLKQQFGVQTMAENRWWGRQLQNEKENDSGMYAVHTLSDTETIAKLATGIKRFTLPEDHNFIKLYTSITGGDGSYQTMALQALATIYENRRMYVKASRYWQRVIDLPNQSKHTYTQAKAKLSQIKDNWGQFEPSMTQPHGKGATVEFRFRNAHRVTFKAFKINVPRLLADVKKYIDRRPYKLDWNKINIGDIGWRLIKNDETRYYREKTAGWSTHLTPRDGHWDRRVTIQTPLKKAGAYLLEATLPGGHTSRIVVWLNDTVIVHKPLNQKSLYFVADAVTGAPLSRLKLSFFGYRRQHIKHNIYETKISRFTKYSDKDGLVVPDPTHQPENYQWLVTATSADGRFAYLGFESVWHRNSYDREYHQTKVFTITDRPVYRPGQTVKFKQWVRQAKYDQEDTSVYAHQPMAIEVRNPKGDRIFEKSITTDSFGGLDDAFELPADATLGVYQIVNRRYGHRGTFRVEEYKKPEFEVTVNAPEEPVTLGERITAEINAKYYFGEPVKEGTVKYKVLRYDHSAQWFPRGDWDWFYNPGYWWFAYDYPWYPGWNKWGCFRPWPWWINRSALPPEVVAEQEIEIPEDGRIAVHIDTRPAKEIHGDKDHRYEIIAEVTDLSRRTIVGKGQVLVARQPFRVYAWVNRGHYRVGDTIQAEFSAQTLSNTPVQGKGHLALYKIRYDKDMQPHETRVMKWNLATDQNGRAKKQINASKAGQYRLSYTVKDIKGHRIEGGYIFTIMGDTAGKSGFRFDHIELMTDKREYRPGETVNLRINTDQPDSTVVLFVRPANGVYLPPRIIRLNGKSAGYEIPVTKKDMPNFFVEAYTISAGKIHTTIREVIVPPEKRVLNLEIEPSAQTYLPGEKAAIELKLTDHTGKPFIGSTVVTVYDKALEYISGGSNVSDIKEFFWKWRRRHHETTLSNVARVFGNLIKKGERAMQGIGVFGHLVADMSRGNEHLGREVSDKFSRQKLTEPSAAPMKEMKSPSLSMKAGLAMEGGLSAADDRKADQFGDGSGQTGQAVQPMLRTKFADAAFWEANITTDQTGSAMIHMTMPDNLTGWNIRVWSMGHGTKVGEASTVITTKKNLMLRLQAPRFFIEKDEVVLSANVHNYLTTSKSVDVVLETDGECLALMPGVSATQQVIIDAGGEKRVDWRIAVKKEGLATIRMKALTDEESDAMQMRFPVYVHGAEKMEAWSGRINPDQAATSFVIDVPQKRRIGSARLEIRYSPTLAGAMVDALPYLADYPYGCTEQTLNRFLPTVITQKILLSMGLDLKDIEQKRTNLNAQEIGDDTLRAKQWRKRETTHDEHGNIVTKNPVFDEQEVNRMVKAGIKALTEMQLSDGGWGWFSGYQETSWPHTTAYVVHGLQIARQNDVSLPPGVMERGIEWLKNFEAEQVRRLKLWEQTKEKGKSRADNLDAFIYMVLSDAGLENPPMGNYLYRDRNHLAVYAKAMTALAYHVNRHSDKRDMLIKNIAQYLVRDDENQTAYLNLGNDGYWWYWYGSEYEAQAYYLKLLAKTDAVKDWKAPYLVKYLLNNRKHATYWKSTRDTAIVIEAFADYLKATKEHTPDLTLEILVDGKKRQKVVMNAQNLFSYNNAFVLTGDAVKTGKHTITLNKKGTGPLYFNAYLSFFSLEDFITKAGLEVKVQRKVYELISMDASIKAAGSRGQAVDRKIEKFKRERIDSDTRIKSGDLLEVELTIDSKNDYEYLIFEDFKAAGCEAVDVRSGYTGNEMGAYVEFRDNRVAFFVRQLARGRHSVSYRLRAEIPGRFSALPAQGYAMYAPELRGNSDEVKVNIVDF